MKDVKAIRGKLNDEIKDLDGGLRSVAESMNVTERYLQDILSAKSKRRVRLVTFEKIKTAVKAVQESELEREQALLA